MSLYVVHSVDIFGADINMLKQEMTRKSLGKITHESLIQFFNHVKTSEEQYWRRDRSMEKAIKNVIANTEVRSSVEDYEDSVGACSQDSGSASEQIYSSTDTDDKGSGRSSVFGVSAVKNRVALRKCMEIRMDFFIV
jgi:hypothetical protein